MISKLVQAFKQFVNPNTQNIFVETDKDTILKLILNPPEELFNYYRKIKHDFPDFVLYIGDYQGRKHIQQIELRIEDFNRIYFKWWDSDPQYLSGPWDSEVQQTIEKIYEKCIGYEQQLILEKLRKEEKLREKYIQLRSQNENLSEPK